jgi:hypothetical protein
MSGSIKGSPAIAVTAGGVVYVVVKDSQDTYRLVTYVPGSGFGSWQSLGKAFSSDPVMSASPDGSLYILGIDHSGVLWSGWFAPVSYAFQGWTLRSSNVHGTPAITAGTDGVAYLVTRDGSNGLWLGRVQQSNWLGWSAGGAIVSEDPQIASRGDGTVQILIQDSSAAIRTRQFTQGTASGWGTWTATGGTYPTVSLGAHSGQVYIVGRDAASDLWRYNLQTGQWALLGHRGFSVGGIATSPRFSFPLN